MAGREIHSHRHDRKTALFGLAYLSRPAIRRRRGSGSQALYERKPSSFSSKWSRSIDGYQRAPGSPLSRKTYSGKSWNHRAKHAWEPGPRGSESHITILPNLMDLRFWRSAGQIIWIKWSEGLKSGLIFANSVGSAVLIEAPMMVACRTDTPYKSIAAIARQRSRARFGQPDG